MENKEKKAFLIMKIFAYVLIYIVLFALVINTALGYVNFNNIQNDKKPYFIFNTKVYKNEDELITSYRFGIYIIICVKRQEEITYNVKLWFNKDF